MPSSTPLLTSFTADPTCIELKDLTIHPHGRNAPLCDRINLRVNRGEIFAILGPSGCGKSTLFSFLSHRLRNIDDWNVRATECRCPENVVLVPQHDVFFPYDTPISALSFIYQKNNFCSDADAVAAAERTLELVGLSDREKWNTPIGEAGYDSSVTGGERRLLAIARALMTSPDAILLDEPTTGLDTWTALSIVRVIKMVGLKCGTSFILTLHQPSDALIAEFDGRILRLQPPLPKPEPKGLAAVDYTPLQNNNTGKGLFFMLIFLLRRVLMRYARNPTALLLRLVGGMMLGSLLGVAYLQLPYDDPRFIADIIGMCMGVTATTFAPIVFSSTLFPLEKAHFMDEHPLQNGPVLFADALARFLVDILVAAASTTLMMIAVPMIGIEKTGGFFLTVWLQSWASDSFGFFVSTLAEPHVSIGTLIPTLGFISCAVGTGIMAPEKSGAGWIYHVAEWASFFKYGSSAMALQELPRSINVCDTCFYRNGQAALEAMELTGDGWYTTQSFNWFMLVMMAVAFRLLSLISVNVLISRGAAHFYYTKSSAGAAFKETEMEEKKGASVAVSASMKKKSIVFRFANVVEALHPKHLRKEKETIMLGNNLIIDESTFTAVLGPTGCGKSVLLQSMTGRLGAGLSTDRASPIISGHLDRPVNIQFDDGRDKFSRNLSVLEGTMHGARLHFPNMSEKELEDHCLEHLAAFGLAPKKSDSLHKLSGGETKRLQVVVKLVTCPDILVLDEPTSGLDSNAAEALLKHLHRVAKNGMRGQPITIIASMKQPEPRNLKNFDNFVFLNDDGDIIVDGNEFHCRKFFGVPPTHEAIWADAALLNIHGESIHHLIPGSPAVPNAILSANERLEGASPTRPLDNALKKDVKPLSRRADHLSFGRAFSILVRRDFQQRWQRAPGETLAVFLMRYCMIPAIFSILLWDVGSNDPVYQNRYALLFMVIASHMFTTFISVAISYPLNRPIYQGEILGNMYSPLTYLMQQWFGLALVEDIAGCILACVITKFCTGMNINFGWMVLDLFVLSQACVGISTMLGQFHSIVVASGLAVGALLPMMFAGTLMVSVRQMARTVIFRMVEAMSLARSGMIIALHSELEESHETHPSLFFAGYGLDDPTWWYRVDVQWAILIFYLVVYRLAAIFVFSRQFRHSLPVSPK